MRRGVVLGVLVLGCVGLLAGTARADTITSFITFGATGTDPTSAYLSHGGGVVNLLSTSWGDDSDFVRYQHLFAVPEGSLHSATLQVSLRDDDDLCGLFGGCESYRIRTESGSDTDDRSLSAEPHADLIYTLPVAVNHLLDGQFIVRVNSTEGDFYVDWSRLTVEYTPAPRPPEPVPEPGSLLLLGTGLAGLHGFRRRRH